MKFMHGSDLKIKSKLQKGNPTIKSHSELEMIKHTSVKKTIRAETCFDLFMHNNLAHLFCKCKSQESEP